jgi:hypothetical protein
VLLLVLDYGGCSLGFLSDGRTLGTSIGAVAAIILFVSC